MKKISIALCMAGLLFASCQQKETSLSDILTIVVDTESIVFDDPAIPEGFQFQYGADDNGTNYLDFLWPNYGDSETPNIPNEIKVKLVIKTFGPPVSGKNIKLKLEQSNQSLANEPGYYRSGWPEATYKLANGGEYSIAAGTGKVEIPLTLLLDDDRLNHNAGTARDPEWLGTVGYLTTFAISSSEYQDDKTVLRISNNSFLIRVRKGY